MSIPEAAVLMGAGLESEEEGCARAPKSVCVGWVRRQRHGEGGDGETGVGE